MRFFQRMRSPAPRLTFILSVCRQPIACLALLLCLASAAEACPMCAETVAADDNMPTAYMYSILFMLTMPLAVFSGIGTAIYLTIKKHQSAQAALPESIPAV